MPKPYSSKEVIKRLIVLGFLKVSQKGSHLKMKHPNGPVTIIPINKKILPPGTVNGILEKAQISKTDFENAK